jgi:hypothetical protein
MAKFLFTPTVYSEKVVTARLGANAANTRANDNDVGKFVKLGGDSNYVLVSAADAIEGVVTSVETGVYDGYSLGGVVSKGFVEATANGLQATPGVGALAVGEYVLATAPAAIQVADTAPRKVVKATDQAAAKAAPFKARVVSLGTAASGAVGTTVVIELL